MTCIATDSTIRKILNKLGAYSYRRLNAGGTMQIAVAPQPFCILLLFVAT